MIALEPDAQRQSLPIAITMGDPAGVGLQITAMAWRHRAALALPSFVVYADLDAVRAHIANLDVAIPILEIQAPSQAMDVFQQALPICPIPLSAPLQIGRSNPQHACAVIRSIETAVEDVMQERAAAVVTNPISKASLTAAGFPHPGHTEFLGALARRARADGKTAMLADEKPIMMLVCDTLRVVPLTVHIPLADVARAVSGERIVATVRTVAQALVRDFALESPRIVIAGLNPHAGEQATLGLEERDIIGPALEQLRTEGLNVRGPLPADTLFHDNARKTYDVAICMYHDQALIPIKTLAFDRGVNITLGLPFVRTSPDHGTALDIVGSDQVSATSLIESLKSALMIVRNRQQFAAKSAPSREIRP